MSNRNLNDQKTINEAIKNYIELYGITTTRQIAEFVESEIGIKPSPTTIAAALKNLGYSAKRQSGFFWERK